MAIQKSKYWFVPRHNLFMPRQSDNYEGAELQLANADVSEGRRQPVEAGSPFTILLKSVYITKDVDDNSNNDLLVRSWSKYGQSPQIETVHLLKKNVPEKQIIKKDQLTAEHILSAQSYQEQNLVWLKLAVVDVKGEDINDDELEEIGQSFKAIADKFGAVFPGMKSLPGAFSSAEEKVAKAAGIFDKVRDVIGSKKERNLFEASLDLCSVGSGETPFCYGAYIFFYDYDRKPEKEEVDGSKYRLKEFQLESKDGFELPQYVVIEVIPEVTNSRIGKDRQEDILLNQHLAAGSLLSDETKNTNPQQMKRFEYLQKLMKKTIEFDELIEYKRLIAKGILTEAEEKRKRLLSLSSKVSKYLDLIDDVF